MNPAKIFDTLMALKTVQGLTPDAALKRIGKLVDLSLDLRRVEGNRHAITLAERCDQTALTSEQKALLNYFLANAWSNIRQLTRSNARSEWTWEQAEIEQEIVSLRRSLMEAGFQQLPKERRCQVLTNLGNVMNHVGRFIDAVEAWDRGLAILPSFGMALANRGFGLMFYAMALYDRGHQQVFLQHAHHGLAAGLKQGVDAPAIPLFSDRKKWIESILTEEYLRQGIDMESYRLGRSKAELQYRTWCLKNRLFLNPLNDLGAFPIAARDVFLTPSIVAGIREGPHYQGFFNQLKQEFVSARYFYYDGITSTKPHFSDKGVLLVNTLDYPSYSLAVEKLRVAFRMAYSLFDKIAYFLNDYLKLQIAEHKVNFRTFWYDTQQKKKGLRSQLKQYENWPLRGLFWLSKDLYEDQPGFREAIEPDAQALREIRNHAEHKYLKIHEMWSPECAASNREIGFVDKLAYSVGRLEFTAKVLRILKLTRAGLIYLSLGVHCEERHRAMRRKNKGGIMPMFLDTWEDHWKV